MARVTIQDCLANIENPFHLVHVATSRARDLSMGASPYVKTTNQKPTVIALREIAAGLIDENGKLKDAFKAQFGEVSDGDQEDEDDADIEGGRMDDEGSSAPASEEQSFDQDDASSHQENLDADSRMADEGDVASSDE